MKKILFVLSLTFFSAQSQEKPKLVVGIVVDQMRYDYVYRFWNQFSETGIKRLVNEGFFCRNTHYSYMPTYTGPGHASIFTGTTPSTHGIIGNNWYDKKSAKSVYCAGDGSASTICDCENHIDVNNTKDGQMSPHRLLTSTMGDELKLFNPNSKVIGISLKDRGAILPAGHSANAAYWMNNDGDWITSDYYMDALPEWLIEYQREKPSSSYFKGSWEADGFSYDMDSLLASKGPSAIKSTPFGNEILKDLAIEIIKKEKLGQGTFLDMLSVSFSSTDYIGHQYGPHAAELIDTYIKLDKDISELLTALEKAVGKENCLVFLTSDHGVVSVPNELKERKIPAGYFVASRLKEKLTKILIKKYGQGEWVLNYSNQQIFLNSELIAANNISKKEIQQYCADYLLEIDGVQNTYTAHQLHHYEYQNSFASLIQKGFHQKYSGDVIISLESGWIEWNYPTGTTHGSCYSYDTHVPLLFWGKDITKGYSDSPVFIEDIAPTVCTLIGISFPNGCTGNPIIQVTE